MHYTDKVSWHTQHKFNFGLGRLACCLMWFYSIAKERYCFDVCHIFLRCIAANVFIHHELVDSAATETGLDDEMSSDVEEDELQEKIVYKIGKTVESLSSFFALVLSSTIARTMLTCQWTFCTSDVCQLLNAILNPVKASKLTVNCALKCPAVPDCHFVKRATFVGNW